MKEIRKTIEGTIYLIDEITKLMYQQKSDEAYSKVNDLYGYLAILSDELEDSIKLEFNKKLIEAMNALQDKDAILFADILRYDIMNILEEISQIKSEV